jgi:hypothetical protein
MPTRAKGTSETTPHPSDGLKKMVKHAYIHRNYTILPSFNMSIKDVDWMLARVADYFNDTVDRLKSTTCKNIHLLHDFSNDTSLSVIFAVKMEFTEGDRVSGFINEDISERNVFSQMKMAQYPSDPCITFTTDWNMMKSSARVCYFSRVGSTDPQPRIVSMCNVLLLSDKLFLNFSYLHLFAATT